MQKYVFLKLDLKVKRQYFRYKEYINWLQIDEILTYVFMYGGSFHLVFAVRAPKKRCDYFWPVFWPENAFSPFSYTGELLVCKNEKLNCFDIQCVVEASSFSLNHNMTLESKENYPRHTKIVQNSLGFMPEVKPLHKPRGDLVLCALHCTEICERLALTFRANCKAWKSLALRGDGYFFFGRKKRQKLKKKWKNFHGKRENNYVSHYFFYTPAEYFD